VIICVQCHAYIPDDGLVAHMRWHEEQRNASVLIDAALALASAHVENLIDRMYNAEKQIEALVNRVYLLERHGSRILPPTGDPQSHHHQME
jgi:hypothetical protein